MIEKKKDYEGNCSGYYSRSFVGIDFASTSFRSVLSLAGLSRWSMPSTKLFFLPPGFPVIVDYRN